MAIYKVINGRGTQTHGAMMNCLKYILKADKTTENLTYVTCYYDYEEVTAKNIYLSFLDTKREWDKDDGRQYIHSVLSWCKEENITPENALQFGIRFAEHTYPGHQCAVSVHTDKDHIHCHIVCNSISFLDGHKLQKSKSDLKKDKEYCNLLCKEYGLKIAEKGKHFDGSEIEKGTIIAWAKNAYHLLSSAKNSFLADCGLRVMTALEVADSKDSFIAYMQDHGWETRWNENRKNISFKDKDGHKIRDTTLLKNFGINATKEGILNELERQREDRSRTRTDTGASEGKGTNQEAERRTATAQRNYKKTSGGSQQTKKHHHI